MKKNIIAIILTTFFFVLSFVVTAQTNPPDPEGDPFPPGSGGSSPPAMGGGSAPIGGGTLLLIGLGIAYGTKKIYSIVKENHEELES